MNTTLKCKEVKIKKDRHCFGCTKKHSSGKKMFYLVNIYEGNFCTSYWCDVCNGYLQEIHEGEIGYGDFSREHNYETFKKGVIYGRNTK